MESPQIFPPVSTEKEIRISAESIDQMEDSQALQQVAQLRLEINSLHAELHRLKTDTGNRKQATLTRSKIGLVNLQPTVSISKSTNPDSINQKVIVKNEKLNLNDDNLVKLSFKHENEALGLVMDRGIVTESQLRGLFDNPVAIMESSISKMIDTNTHWIHWNVAKMESGFMFGKTNSTKG